MTVEPDFLYGTNATFIAELYRRYLGDENAVDAGWASFFKELADDERALLGELEGASWAPSDRRVIGVAEAEKGPPPNGEPAGAETVRAAVLDSLRARILIRSHRVRGHLLANLDPLALSEPEYHPELDPASYGFTETDYDRPIFIDGALGLEEPSLREIVVRLDETYCGNIGVEYMHIQETERKAWIQSRIEGAHNRTRFTADGKRAILARLTEAEGFERFLDKKYTGTKRFGLEGAEAAIPALEQIIKRGAQLGVKEIVLGMAHRGRLNVLANVMAKPYTAVFSEFQGNPANPEDVLGSGDVKYHLGTSSDREFDDTMIHLSLTANPSHLEAVDPVVVGKVRAKQAQRGEDGFDAVLGLLIHGDAAYAGQGLVAEVHGLSELIGYRTGGTIHFVINNQIGFTTAPSFSRSGHYCSDVARMVQAPIFHVNGDDAEAAVHVARVAMEYRQEFKSDVVVDMFCYRRHGHNEGDEPSFTQPAMYRRIAVQPTVRELYARQLVAEGVVAEGEVEHLAATFAERLEADFQAANGFRPNKADWLEGTWTGIEIARGEARRGRTAVAQQTLRDIGTSLTRVPDGIHLNRKIRRQLDARRKAIADGEGIDWATAEALSIGSLLIEGTPVRLSGQDSGRGTFSHRHAVLVDQENEDPFVPLDNLSPDQAACEIIDSPLSEASVLGFEYGYSLAEPHALILWEAQFGDFANGAQVIIDQFITSGESKWLRMSGLTMLLPHGYEGQGPEHSSARLERYLQLCAEDNIQVANCTTPSNYFHILRRQMRRNFRKPLILMTPKSLLRHKLAVSRLSEMASGTSFHRVLWDDAPPVPDQAVRRVVLCSGKVYFDLFERRAETGAEGVYLMRAEQLYPFPEKALSTELGRFPRADIVWCQEEPRNMGAWSFIDPRLEALLAGMANVSKRARYVGRAESASTATGLARRHKAEQRALLDDALGP